MKHLIEVMFVDAIPNFKINHNYLESNISRIKEHLTDDEILSAKMELWQKLKP